MVSANQVPIAGVRIYINETKLKTQTDLNGNFELNCNDFSKTEFIVSKAGFETLYLPLDSYKNKPVKIVLEKVQPIEEDNSF